MHIPRRRMALAGLASLPAGFAWVLALTVAGSFEAALAANNVAVCHIPRGNPSAKAHTTILVSAAAVERHLAHGDFLGPCPRFVHTATLMENGQVLLAGGFDGASGPPLATADLFEIDSESFRPAAKMVKARGRHTATLLPDGRVLVVGGWTRQFRARGTAEVYDPATAKFRLLRERLTVTRVAHTATRLANGKVLIVGGVEDTIDSGIWTDTAEIYDPATGDFTPTTEPMETPRAFHTATLLPDGSVLIAGGSPGFADKRTSLKSAELYMPGAGTFEPVSDMTSERQWQVAALVDGQALVVGGRTGTRATDALLASADVYDPNLASFTQVNALSDAKIAHSVTVLPDQRAVIIGGWSREPGGPFEVASVDIFDPMSQTLVPAHSLSVARGFHTATLLPDGRILIVGGTDTPTQSVFPGPELYTPPTP